MSQYLPYGEFKWLSQKEIKNFDVNSMKLHSIAESSYNGCILKVDLDHSDELNYFHNDSPLAPEKLEISNDMLSKYSSEIAKNMK